jgi:SNF2 family DNA or RNA helicase
VAFLSATQSALLADDMGLGKTVQVASAVRILRRAGALRNVLIVAPASLLTNWIAELGRWAPGVGARRTATLERHQRRVLWDLPIPVTVTSYETLRSDFLPRPPASFDLVVFDEAQRLKNRDAEVAIAARLVPADRRWALSGTPLENGVADLASIAEVLRLLPFRSQDTPLPELLEAFQGHFLRRRKFDVLPELPPIIDQELPLELAGSQAREYREVAESLDDIRGQDYGHLLAAITRLKLICNRASDDSSVKLEALLEILGSPDMGSARMIVISQYAKTLEWLQPRLPVPSILYTGALNSTQRDAAVQRFRSGHEPCVLLMSMKAGGVGLNLSEATHVVVFDRWWNPAVEQQAIHRGHRFGRTERLLVYRFKVTDTVEERIVALLQQRSDLFDYVVDERLVDEALPPQHWTREDLLAVLAAR